MDLPFAVPSPAEVATAPSASARSFAGSSAGPIVYDNLRSGHFGPPGAAEAEAAGGAVPRPSLVGRGEDYLKGYPQHQRPGGGGGETASHDDDDDDDDDYVPVSEEDAGAEAALLGPAGVVGGGRGRGMGAAADGDADGDCDGGAIDLGNYAFLDGRSGTRDADAAAGGSGRGDVLSLLLSGPPAGEAGGAEAADGVARLTGGCQEGAGAARRAASLARAGEAGAAASEHARAAAAFRAAALAVREDEPAVSRSLLLLSLAQARAAEGLVSRGGKEGAVAGEGGAGEGSGNQREGRKGRDRSGSMGEAAFEDRGAAPKGAGGAPGGEGAPEAGTKEERIRAKIRGAMETGTREADLTDSMFLGPGTGVADRPRSAPAPTAASASAAPTVSLRSQERAEEDFPTATNPVDDMMRLESELRDMDFALKMGSSVASLSTRASTRTGRAMDGSFYVVPSGGAGGGATQPLANMSSSSVLRASPFAAPSRTASRARAGAGGTAGRSPQESAPGPAAAASQSAGLESSWWGGPGVGGGASIMAASISSISGSGATRRAGGGGVGGQSSTKELLRLLDTIKTLSDENAALMREVEGAQSARHEARVAREQMKRFKADYAKRFVTLKAALGKFRQQYGDSKDAGAGPPPNSSAANPLLGSDFSKSASEAQKKDALVRKLTADLKKEKEDSKKKDAALRKYESFYREVKARSAQKAMQRQQDQQRLEQQQRAKAGINRTVR
jgi:hypothetical protein